MNPSPLPKKGSYIVTLALVQLILVRTGRAKVNSVAPVKILSCQINSLVRVAATLAHVVEIFPHVLCRMFFLFHKYYNLVFYFY